MKGGFFKIITEKKESSNNSGKLNINLQIIQLKIAKI